MIRAARIVASTSLLISGCAPAQPPSDPRPALAGFDWLAGCWLSRDGAVERWEPPSGPEMHAIGLIPQGDGAQIGQTLQIATSSDGEITYRARLDGGDEVSLTLVRNADRRAVFENPNNESPKRVIYRREGDALVTTVYESLEEAATGWESRYVSCANSGAAP